MSIITFSFFVFIAITMLLYYITPARFRWVVLLAASVFFFIEGCSVKRFILILCMSLLAWLSGLIIGKINSKLDGSLDETPNKRLIKWKKRTTALAIIMELLILIAIKDNSFFINNANKGFHFFGSSINLTLPSWAAPLGISYITLILISYILDVSWGTSNPQRNPAKFLLFSTYFPQVTSGPFVRYHEMENQLFVGHKFNYQNFCFGLQRIIWGLFKKLIIAQRLSILVGTIYDDYIKYNGFYIFIAVIGYTLQVYADFSGCMDIIIGASELFGITMPENFKTPFFSTNLSEVWRRWHMTLGFWVKDYVLYPVLKSEMLHKIGIFCKKKFGKQAGKRIPTYIGMFVTWFTVGFWHGGSWKFIFGSGLFFFIMIVGGQLLEPVFKIIIRILKINTECFSWTLFQRIRTFFLFAASVSFGRALSLATGVKMWRAALHWNPWILVDQQSLYSLGLDRQNFWVMIYGLLIFLIISMLQQKGSIREMLTKQNLVFRWIILLVTIFSVLIFGCYGPGFNAADFIYGGF